MPRPVASDVRRTVHAAAALAAAVAAAVAALAGCGGGRADRVSATTAARTAGADVPSARFADAHRPSAEARAEEDAAAARAAERDARAGAASTRAASSADGSGAESAAGTGDGPLAGRRIVIDPGHNGGNAAHPSAINRLVGVGNGRKACDTTGTESVRGLSEHRFNWLVAHVVRRELQDRGATVILTRPSDTGVGPCVNRRMTTADRRTADLAVSIHADGGPPGGRGFHVILPGRVPQVAGHDRIVAPSARLGRALRAAFRRGTGMPYSTYLGRRGLDVRTDLGGLNLVHVPAVFIETGNMRNATDARLLGDPAWRERAGRAVAQGIADDLTRDGG